MTVRRQYGGAVFEQPKVPAHCNLIAILDQTIGLSRFMSNFSAASAVGAYPKITS